MIERRARALAVLFGALSAAGCYNYYPATARPPSPGTRITAELSEEGTRALSSYVGPSVTAVDGRLLRVSDTELAISVVAVRQFRGDATYWKGEEVRLPRSLVARLTERHFAPSKTALAIGATAVGAMLMRSVFDGMTSGSAPHTGTGPGGSN